MSVLDKAATLTAHARTYAEGGKERSERQQIASMLGQLEHELENLEGAVAAYVEASFGGVQLPDVVVEVTAGMEALQGRVEQGLPTQQALRSARDRVRQAAGVVRGAVSAAWRPWAESRIHDLHVTRVALLPVQHRRRAEEIVRRLRVAAGASQPTAPVITQFVREVDDLRRILEQVDERGELVRLLHRIRMGAVTLVDLTRDEVDLLLSDDDVASQVVLRLA